VFCLFKAAPPLPLGSSPKPASHISILQTVMQVTTPPSAISNVVLYNVFGRSCPFHVFDLAFNKSSFFDFFDTMRLTESGQCSVV